MKRIELFGPMGAGKSTLMPYILSEDIILPKNVVHKGIVQSYKQDSFLKYLIFSIFRFTPISSRVLADYDIYKFIKAKDINLINQTIDNFHRARASGERYIFRLNWFLSDLVASKIIERTSSERSVLMDEFLLQRLLMFSSFNYNENFVRTYLESIILPHALIYIHANEHALISRVNNRASYVHEADEVVETCRNAKKIISILKEFDVQVIDVDTSEDIAISVSKLNKKLQVLRA